MLHCALPSFVLLGLIAPPASASVPIERIVFARGGEAVLPARPEGDEIVLAGPGRDYRFRPREIASRRAVSAPALEWPQRRSEALASGSASDRLDAALWALRNGLTDEAEAFARLAHRSDPGDESIARLVMAWDRLADPLPDPDLARYRRYAGPDARIATGPHVLLAHDLDDAEAAERIQVMERVVTTFYVLFAARGFDLKLPERKLVAVWFPKRSAYDAYLKGSGNEGFLGTRGHYHPALRFLAICDARTEPDLGRERAVLERMDGLSPVPPDRERRRLLYELERRRIELGVVAHELVHALVDYSGLEPRARQFPYWFHEGLAMQFEGVVGGRWGGVSLPLPERLERLGRLKSPPRLELLLSDRLFGRGADSNAYAQAWALVDWMMAERPVEFRDFLERLRGSHIRPGDASAAVVAFRAAFGDDLAMTEADWRGWMKRQGEMESAGAR